MSFRNRTSDGSVLVGCGVCGCPAMWPDEFKLRADKILQCYRHSDTTTNLEEAQKHGRIPRGQGEFTPRFLAGVKPGWYP